MMKSVIARFVGLFSLAILSLALVSGVASANNDPTLAAGQTHNGFYANAGQQLNVDGMVNGDAWLAGNTIHITGMVSGNLYAAGSEVVIDGVVHGNAHVMGSKVTVNGTVEGVLYTAGSQVTIGKTAHNGGGMVAAGSLIEDNGTIGGQVYAYGNEVKINGPVNGNVTIHASQIELTDQAQISGDLRYDQNAKADISNDKLIGGSVTKIQAPASKTNPVLDKLQGLVFGLLASLLLGLVIVSVLPGSSVAVADFVQTKPGQSFLAGLGFLIVVPVVTILVLITTIGLSLAAVLGMTYLSVLIVSQTFVGLWLGRLILKNPKPKFIMNLNSLLIGLGILSVIGLVPVLGALAGFLVVSVGSGALVLRSYERLKVVRAKQLS